MRGIERKRERQRYRQREKQAPCREPDVGLDPWTPGLRPEPKADDTQPLSHRAAILIDQVYWDMELVFIFFFIFF